MPVGTRNDREPEAAPLSEAEIGATRVRTDVPPVVEPKMRHEQDTQVLDGAAAIDPPPGSELIQRPRVQG